MEKSAFILPWCGVGLYLVNGIPIGTSYSLVVWPQQAIGSRVSGDGAEPLELTRTSDPAKWV